MANKIILKKSSVAAKVPLTTDLTYGELALNYADGALYYKNASGTISNLISAGSWIRKTANYTAVTGGHIIADTSGGTFTITLPASPATGNSVVIADGASWATNNLTIARNSSTIEGLSENLTLDVAGVQVELVYDGTTWELFTFAAPAVAAAKGGGSDQVFFENGQQVTTSYAIPTGKNAMSAGPITVNAGASVTIPTGSTWTIV